VRRIVLGLATVHPNDDAKEHADRRHHGTFRLDPLPSFALNG
jgi:hypothetical protein